MAQILSIYLSGTIKKKHEQGSSFWTLADLDYLQNALSEYSLFYLNPAERSNAPYDQRAVFGRDLTQVFCCDVLFADLRDRRGLGVGAEMMFAKVHGIPVLGWAPPQSHYHQSQMKILDQEVQDWVHPFVESLCDYLVSDIQEAADWIRRERPMRGQAKDLRWIEQAMRYYQEASFQDDAPMQALVAKNERIAERLSLVQMGTFEYEKA